MSEAKTFEKLFEHYNVFENSDGKVQRNTAENV